MRVRYVGINAGLDIRATACIGRFELTGDSVRLLPRRQRGEMKSCTPGYWLEYGDGYRLPAWRHIGTALLKGGVSPLYVCIRRTSKWSLSAEAVERERYEKISPEEFSRVRLLREGGEDKLGLADRVKGLFGQVERMAAKVRYESVQLFYDSVSACIAEDKVAETIGGYLYAVDDRGGQVRRPLRRGVAYRMLKEFGNGNVFMSLRDSYRDLLTAVAGHAVRGGRSEAGLELLAPVLS